jgi:hypothetical protein
MNRVWGLRAIGKRLLRHQAPSIEHQHRAPAAGGRAVAGDNRGSTAHVDGSNCPMRVEDSVRHAFGQHRAVWGRKRREEGVVRAAWTPAHSDIWTFGHRDIWASGRDALPVLRMLPLSGFASLVQMSASVQLWCAGSEGGDPSAINQTGSFTRVSTRQVARSSVHHHAGRGTQATRLL